MLVIGLTGYAGAGKDTVGAHLVNKHGFHRVAFADAVKEMALVIDPLIFAGLGFGWRWRDGFLVRLSVIVKKLGWDKAKKIAGVRKFLQRLGTQAVRNIIGEDAWILAASKTIGNLIDEHGTDIKIVITDVRFPNEQTYILEDCWRSAVIRIERPDFDSGVSHDHESERYVPTLGAPEPIVNSDSIALLEWQVDNWLEKNT